MSPSRLSAASLLLVALLPACVQNGGDCAREDRRELRTVEKLIAETRADMARGYRQQEGSGNGSVNFCLGGGGSNVGVSFCADPTRQSRAVAVDMAAEERKLQGLEARRLALQSGIHAKEAGCTGSGAL
jgi:hypothetical protein